MRGGGVRGYVWLILHFGAGAVRALYLVPPGEGTRSSPLGHGACQLVVYGKCFFRWGGVRFFSLTSVRPLTFPAVIAYL